MLFVDVPCAMSFRTLCLPCGVCRPRYALRIFRPTIPSTYASPRAVSLVVFTDMAIVRREISSSISYTASFLGTICLEVPSPIPTVFFLHLTVALQRRTVYDFLISGHLLPDRELREREYLMFLGNILQAVIHFHEMIAFFDNIAARGKMAVFVDAGIPAIRLIIEIRFYLIRHIQHFQIVHINTPQRFLIGYAGVKAVTVQILCQIDDVPHRRTVIAAVEDGLQCFQLR